MIVSLTQPFFTTVFKYQLIILFNTSTKTTKNNEDMG
ncbi:hypothetical protein HNQ92_002308 [Rhabdobacter roseus]|uniref:Uncharacterized protein n=1 Tax=Rhabdobacter roseus TaxID=1655419 RepID=A0A840TMK0_9BACT|nr:hypothetical protein [Rhabdobacter roseus]